MKRYYTNVEAHNQVVDLLKRNFEIENTKLINRLNRMHKLNTNKLR